MGINENECASAQTEPKIEDFTFFNHEAFLIKTIYSVSCGLSESLTVCAGVLLSTSTGTNRLRLDMDRHRTAHDWWCRSKQVGAGPVPV